MTNAEKIAEAKRLLSEVAADCKAKAEDLRAKPDLGEQERWDMINLEYLEGHLHKYILHPSEGTLDYYVQVLGRISA
jgi:hypothetical protein